MPSSLTLATLCPVLVAHRLCQSLWNCSELRMPEGEILTAVGRKENCGRLRKTRALFLCKYIYRSCFNLVKESDTANQSLLPTDENIEVNSKKAFQEWGKIKKIRASDLIPLFPLSEVNHGNLLVSFCQVMLYAYLCDLINEWFFLRWVSIAARGLSLVAQAGLLSSHGAQLLVVVDSLGAGVGSRAWVQQSRCTGLVCPAACGVFLDQESIRCPLHWQADS